MAEKISTARPRLVRPTAVAIGLLVAIVLVSAAVRIAVDWPNILAGTEPTENDFARRYVAHPWLAYVHIAPGLVYLLGAPLQLSRRFRTRHYNFHRRLGRVLLTCALISGLFALFFGVPYAWAGAPEAVATVVFGCWFLVCLVLAFRAIRGDDVRQHRRWMIRAFAVAIGIGTIRIWVGIFEGVEQATSGGTSPGEPDPTMFGIAFWLAFTMHVAVGEWWLRRTPALTG
ncbi:DUF2306 domain-containing protein [Arthrobacter sp. JZ12]|uniref:DUF2306 domain-containing protein n=1 Tax=Arthrobacter sp. JZ12 TaxID=2654190 RepID=UPI002B4A6B8B|nr:DUF2306 domain-containing protein [Arthrobacter sp. JZ12]WRH25980.1 DUF2306 domain-containing protein [Arthrobacter sp. JZ12]